MLDTIPLILEPPNLPLLSAVPVATLGYQTWLLVKLGDGMNCG